MLELSKIENSFCSREHSHPFSEWQWAAKVWQSEDNEFLAAISQYLENYFSKHLEL